MGRPVKLSSEKIEKLKEDYQKYKSLKTLSVLYKLHPKTIKRILAQNGVDTDQKGRSLTTDQEIEILELFKTDTIAGVAETLNISWGTVKKILKKYGIENHAKECTNDLRTRKINRTCSTLYGTPCALSNNSVKEKRDKTIRDKYGVDNISQSEDIKKKKKQTTLKNYGVENPSQSFLLRQKIETTNMIRYGHPYPSMTLERRRALKARMLVEGKQIAQKAKVTNLKTYGVRSPLQTLNAHQKSKHTYYYENQSFDSMPELALFIYATEHGEPIERLPTKLKYFFENEEHYYFPDFLYKGQLVELKNPYLYEKLMQEDTQEGAKYECMVEHQVIIMLPSDYAFAVEYCKDKYGRDFARKFLTKKGT